MNDTRDEAGLADDLRAMLAGETIQGGAVLDDVQVAVTNRRVVVCAPDTEGKTYREARRPNVVGVGVTQTSDRGRLRDVDVELGDLVGL